MLIVVVVLVTLMTITFRLGALNTSSWQRNTTVTRLQRLENCLSGYYAAFGSYPPVATLNSRNPFLKVDEWGMQSTDGEEDSNIFNWDVDAFRNGKYQEAEAKAWAQVQAACKAQPVGCSFPFPKDYDEIVVAWSDHLKEEAAASKTLSEAKKRIFSAGFDAGSGSNIGRFSAYKQKIDWRDLQLFKFGLMSYLLPRFLMMMNADESFYDFAQWTGNNALPSDPLTGQMFDGWYEIKRSADDKKNKTDYARVANIPSQAVCARWMPNFEGIISGGLEFYGVDTSDSDRPFLGSDMYNGLPDDKRRIMRQFSRSGYNSNSSLYLLNGMTIVDGWKHEFYYYADPPFQSYRLWSAGKNGFTFPPWLMEHLDTFSTKEQATITGWTKDDISHLAN